MKAIYNLLIIIIGAVVGLAVGFALRGKQPATAESNGMTATTPAEKRPTVAFNNGASLRINDDSPLATKLEHDLSMSSGVTRWLYWLDALEKAKPGDFPRLFQLAQGNPTARRFVAARWVEVAPRHLFDLLLAAPRSGSALPVNELASVLFSEWPKRDPDAAIAAVNKAEHALGRDWRFDVAYALVDKDIERAFRLMADWHADDIGFGPSGIAAVSKWTRADPRHAAEFLLGQPPSHAVESTIETVGQEWAKIDPAAALEFATGKPGELGSMLAASAMKAWAAKNLNEAADWLATADERTRNRLSPALVEAWARKDLTGAMTWCAENLSGTSLTRAIAGLAKGAAEKDLNGAASLVTGMDPSAARTEAAVVVAKKWFPGFSSDKAAGADAVGWIASLDSDSVKRVLDEVSWSWATSDAKSIAAFLTQSSSEQVPSYTYNLVARELARKNISEALEWANHLPDDRKLAAGGEAFAQWRSSQPEAAMKWLADLPLNDTRRPAYFESAIQSLAYHPQAADQLAAMSVSERATARSVIQRMELPQDRRSSLLAALK